MGDKLIPPEFLTVPEAARLCGVSRNTVYSWVRQRKLEAYQTPGHTNLIRPSALVRFMHESGMFVPDALGEMARRDAKLGLPATEGDKARKGAALIVEDDPQSRALAFRTFDGSSMVYEAQTGYEALHLLTVHPDISLVILDVEVQGHCQKGTLAEMANLRRDLAVVAVAPPGTRIPSERQLGGIVLERVEKPLALAALRDAVTRARARLGATATPRIAR